MSAVGYTQVQEVLRQVPATKLPLAYRLLSHLVDRDADVASPQVQVMRLPLAERRRLMAQQAEDMIAHYAQSAHERQDWQAGDFDDADQPG